jgi:hypothetical protein
MHITCDVYINVSLSSSWARRSYMEWGLLKKLQSLFCVHRYKIVHLAVASSVFATSFGRWSYQLHAEPPAVLEVQYLLSGQFPLAG